MAVIIDLLCNVLSAYNFSIFKVEDGWNASHFKLSGKLWICVHIDFEITALPSSHWLIPLSAGCKALQGPHQSAKKVY
jgi:hypothetical protein